MIEPRRFLKVRERLIDPAGIELQATENQSGRCLVWDPAKVVLHTGTAVEGSGRLFGISQILQHVSHGDEQRWHLQSLPQAIVDRQGARQRVAAFGPAMLGTEK